MERGRRSGSFQRLILKERRQSRSGLRSPAGHRNSRHACIAMRIRILTISDRQPEWVNQAFAEYARRLPKHLAPELVELPLAKRRDDLARAKSEEGERLLAAMPKSAHVVALDERGAQWGSVELSEQLARWQQSGNDIVLLIGGPDGLAPELLSAARQRWSLSKLTLPHGLVRVLLAEQIYRAHSILEGHPYHRA